MLIKTLWKRELTQVQAAAHRSHRKTKPQTVPVKHLAPAISCTSILHSTRGLTQPNLSYIGLFVTFSHSPNSKTNARSILSHTPSQEIKPSTPTPSSPTVPQSPPASSHLSRAPRTLRTPVYTRQAAPAPSSLRRPPSRPRDAHPS